MGGASNLTVPRRVKSVSRTRHYNSLKRKQVSHICIFTSASYIMTEKEKAKIKTKFKNERRQEPDCEDEKLESITVRYKGKDYMLELPKNGDAKIICQNIKRETGVKGSFYVHFGDQSSNYIYCSSVTRGNIAKVAEKLFNVTGGNSKFFE